jgi:glycosyltransferase involved in cell wall biosynthesis
MLEAMAAGVPVIASDTPAQREVISSGQTGLLVPLRDPAAMARKTQTLLKDPALASQLSAAGREHASRQFSATRYVEEHEGVYRRLVGK